MQCENWKIFIWGLTGVNCYLGINLDPSKPKGMPLGLKLHSAQLHTASLPNTYIRPKPNFGQSAGDYC